MNCIPIFGVVSLKNFKIFVMYMAGVFLCMHNFVPHHHSEEHIATSHSEQEKHHNTDEDESPLSAIFSQSPHQQVNKEIQYNLKTSDYFQLKVNKTFITANPNTFHAINSLSEIDDPPERTTSHVFSPHPSQISFRGPPVLI